MSEKYKKYHTKYETYQSIWQIPSVAVTFVVRFWNCFAELLFDRFKELVIGFCRKGYDDNILPLHIVFFSLLHN